MNQSKNTHSLREIRKAELYQNINAALQKALIEDKAFTNPYLSVSDLVRLADTNTKYLSNYLRDVIHCRFAAYINRLRVEYAAQLLLTEYGTPIAEIAHRSGFNTVGIFLLRFRENFGMTPSVYRQTDGKGIVAKNSSEDELLADFSRRIRKVYPRLSSNEVRLCHLIHKGIPAAEQARILDITYGSLLVTRCRLREKLELGRSDHLDIIINDALNAKE